MFLFLFPPPRISFLILISTGIPFGKLSLFLVNVVGWAVTFPQLRTCLKISWAYTSDLQVEYEADWQWNLKCLVSVHNEWALPKVFTPWFYHNSYLFWNLPFHLTCWVDKLLIHFQYIFFFQWQFQLLATRVLTSIVHKLPGRPSIMIMINGRTELELMLPNFSLH